MATEKFDIAKCFQSQLKEPEMAGMDEMAAVKTLMCYLLQDTSTTTIQEFIDNMETAQSEICQQTSSLAARTTCDLFIRYITLSHKELESASNFQECKKILMKEGSQFIDRLSHNASTVIRDSDDVIKNNTVILTHSKSKLILGLMTEAHKKGKKFKVYVTDGQPTCQGQEMVKELQAIGVQAEFIYDTEVATKMEMVNSVVVAAEGICEDGGAICRVGFFNIALAAKVFQCKVQVLAESHKFARLFILTNSRIPDDIMYGPNASSKDHPLVDFTPPQYISLIFSDIGVLPTSAVGEYLLDLYT